MFNSAELKRILNLYLIISLSITGMIGIFLIDRSVEEWLAGASEVIIVDSNGNGNFTSIQSAINAAKPGDMIYVWNGTYYESLNVNKSGIKLIGNSSIGCKIIHHHDGSNDQKNQSAGINISADNVTLSGFNIIVSGNYTNGINLNSNSSDSIIVNNSISTFGYSGFGIELLVNSNVNISSNKINTTNLYAYAINIYQSKSIQVIENQINTENLYGYGILLEGSTKANILRNDIKTNESFGNCVILKESYFNHIYNNFLDVNEGTCIEIDIGSYKNSVSNNKLKIRDSSGKGVIVIGSENNISNNSIININNTVLTFNWRNGIMGFNNSATGNLFDGFGIGGMYNKVNNNLINVISISGQETAYNDIKNNKVNSIGLNLFSHNNNIIGNTIISNSSLIIGGISFESAGYFNNIINNTIHVEGGHYTGNPKFGIKLYLTMFTNITHNTLSMKSNKAHAIYLKDCANLNVSNNNINTNDYFEHGIYTVRVRDSIFNYNKIAVDSDLGYGMLLLSSSSNDLNHNKITTLKSESTGLNLFKSSNCNLIGNELRTEGFQSSGIFITNSINHVISENIINTYGSYAHGIDLWLANISKISSNIVRTYGTGSRGTSLIDTLANKLYKNDLKTSGTDAFGFYLDNGFTSIFDSNILSNSFDIAVVNKGNITLKNCSFNSIESTNGVIQVKNYLDIETYRRDGITPFDGADVEIIDNNKIIYSTPGYNGKDETTDNNGKIKRLSVTDRWYYYNNAALENITLIKLKEIDNFNWEEKRPSVDMSSSHTEVFIMSDIQPETPTGLKITRINDENNLRISWDLTINANRYTIYTNKSGHWNVFENVTHPQNWTIDINLEPDNFYYYKIQAHGKETYSSDISLPVGYYLVDLVPKVPTGLSVNAVSGNDALEIKWDPLNEDVLNYEIIWKEHYSDKWFQIENVTSDKWSFIWYNGSLINGTVHDFRIRAWYSGNISSAFSSITSVVHRDFLAPTRPIDLTAEAITDSSIILTWTHGGDLDVVGYKVFINQSGTGPGGPYSLYAQNIKQTNHIINNLKENIVYYFVVSAFDEANNTSPFSNEAWNTTLYLPTYPAIINTDPNNNSLNISVDYRIKLTFNIPMDKNTIMMFFEIDPEEDYQFNWNNDQTILTIIFMKNLSYDTDYSIKIGEARSKSGEILENGSFSLVFRTVMKPRVQLSFPSPNTIVKPGDMIKVSGTSSGFLNGTIIEALIGNEKGLGLIGDNGSWEFQIKAPKTPGDYTLIITVLDQNFTVNIIVETDSVNEIEIEKNNILIIGFVFGLLITFIMIFLVLMILRKREISGKNLHDNEDFEVEE